MGPSDRASRVAGGARLDEPAISPDADGVHAFLDASTAHITAQDNKILSDWAKRSRKANHKIAPYRTIDHSYGFFVHVHLDGAEDREGYEQKAREEGISDAFFKLQEYARTHKCWWINLDTDADEVPGLPTHTW
jgi:hypothetical protein